MKGKTRESTSSITKLVKIVAEEVFEEKFGEEKEDITEKIELEVKKQLSEISVEHSVENQLRKRGEMWSPEETYMLKREFRAFLEQVARNHERTANAIHVKLINSDMIRHFPFFG